MSNRNREHAPYAARQGHIDLATGRFVQRTGAHAEPDHQSTGIEKAQAARTANAAIKRGEHQTTPEGIQRVYDVALKLGILEEAQVYDPQAGPVAAAWIDPSDNTLHDTTE